MFSPVRSPRVYEHIVGQIERAIYEGRLEPGDKLPPERLLVQQFHASRVAVREALRTLEHRGLVAVRQGAAGGYFIREVDSGLLLRDLETLLRLGRVTLAQLTEARLLIEPEMARLAALRAAPSDLDALALVLDDRAALVRRHEHPRVLDIEFHRLIAGAADNPVHAVLTHALMDLEAEVVVPRIHLTEEDNREVDAAHREILRAMVDREAARARACMEAHIVDVQRRLRRVERDATATDQQANDREPTGQEEDDR